MSDDGGQITRRSFLTVSAAAGATVLACSKQVEAIRFPVPLARALEETLPSIGRLTYAQAHVTPEIDLTSALGMVEFAARGRRLDKVAALGDMDSTGLPKHIMATLHMDRGLRCVVTSTAPISDRLAFFRGEKASVIVTPKKLQVLDTEDTLRIEPPLQDVPYSAESVALPHVLEALRTMEAKQISA